MLLKLGLLSISSTNASNSSVSYARLSTIAPFIGSSPWFAALL